MDSLHTYQRGGSVKLVLIGDPENGTINRPQCNATQINAMGVESPKSDEEHRVGISALFGAQQLTFVSG